MQEAAGSGGGVQVGPSRPPSFEPEGAGPALNLSLTYLCCLQGLNWYCTDLRRDSDGDLAHGFYEEPECPPEQGGGRKGGKKGKKPPASCCDSRAQPAGPGSVVLVTGGNVQTSQR